MYTYNVVQCLIGGGGGKVKGSSNSYCSRVRGRITRYIFACHWERGGGIDPCRREKKCTFKNIDGCTMIKLNYICIQWSICILLYCLVHIVERRFMGRKSINVVNRLLPMFAVSNRRGWTSHQPNEPYQIGRLFFSMRLWPRSAFAVYSWTYVYVIYGRNVWNKIARVSP